MVHMFPKPFHGFLDTFLYGSAHIDIDTIFAKPFDTVFAELMLDCTYSNDDRYEKPENLQWSRRIDKIPSAFIPNVWLSHFSQGVLAYSPDGQPIGGYIGCDLAVDPDWQGMGLGKELVIERCLIDGCNPVSWLDCASYSPAGYRTHVAAWHHARTYPEETFSRLYRQEVYNVSHDSLSRYTLCV